MGLFVVGQEINMNDGQASYGIHRGAGDGKLAQKNPNENPRGNGPKFENRMEPAKRGLEGFPQSQKGFQGEGTQSPRQNEEMKQKHPSPGQTAPTHENVV